VDRAGSTYRSFFVPARAIRSADTWFPSPVIADSRLANRLVAAHRALEQSVAPSEAALLVGALDELVLRHGAVRPIRPASARGAAVEVARAYFERNFASRVRLETVSAVAGLTIYQLIRAFRSEFGLSPYAFLEQIRVHRAASMLRDGRAISQVAFLTGFSDQSHLTRFFKRAIGVSPGRYRTSALRCKQAALSQR
jgi:AraC-like DNA-binding protein